MVMKKRTVKDQKKEVHEILIDRYKLKIEVMKRGVTQNQLAEMCGLSRATISNIVCGRSCNDKTGYKIAQALGMEIEDLK